MGKRIMNVELGLLPWRVLNLGYVGENEHTQIVIDCTEVLLDYPEATCSMVVKPPRGDLYPVMPTKSGNTFIWEITASDVVYAGSGQIQLTFYNGEEIIRSDIGSTKVAASLETTGDAPEPLQNWMDAAEQTAAQIAEAAAEGVVDDLADAKDEAIAAIEAKGQEVIEDIPSDYSELSDDVDDLKSAINDVSKRIGVSNIAWSDVVDNKKYRKSDGKLTNYNYCRSVYTDMVPCNPGDTFLYTGATNNPTEAPCALFYAEDGTYISAEDGNPISTSGNTKTITIPANAYKVIFQLAIIGIGVQITEHDAVQTNPESIEVVDKKIENLAEKDEDLFNRIGYSDIVWTEVDNQIYRKSDGKLVGYNYCKTAYTDLIPCTPGNVFLYEGYTNDPNTCACALYYDENELYIGNESGYTVGYMTQKQKTITIPSDCYFVRFQLTLIGMNQTVSGYKASQVMPYSAVSLNEKIENVDNDIESLGKVYFETPIVYNEDEIINGKLNSDGTVDQSITGTPSLNWTTGYIEVDPYKTYSLKGQSGFACYDEDKIFKGSSAYAGNNNIINFVDKTVKYVRISIGKNSYNNFIFAPTGIYSQGIIGKSLRINENVAEAFKDFGLYQIAENNAETFSKAKNLFDIRATNWAYMANIRDDGLLEGWGNYNNGSIVTDYIQVAEGDVICSNMRITKCAAYDSDKSFVSFLSNRSVGDALCFTVYIPSNIEYVRILGAFSNNGTHGYDTEAPNGYMRSENEISKWLIWKADNGNKLYPRDTVPESNPANYKIVGSYVDMDYSSLPAQNSEFMRMVKCESIRAVNHTKHIYRIGNFNQYVQRHQSNWPVIKNMLADYGIDICGFEEAQYYGTQDFSQKGSIGDYMRGCQFGYCPTFYPTGATESPYSNRDMVSMFPVTESEELQFPNVGQSSYNNRSALRTKIKLPRYLDCTGGDQYLGFYVIHPTVDASYSQQEAEIQVCLDAMETDGCAFHIIAADSNAFDVNPETGMPIVWDWMISKGFKIANNGWSKTVTDPSPDHQGSIDQIFVSNNINIINFNVINSNEYAYIENGTLVPLSDHDFIYADVEFDYSDVITKLRPMTEVALIQNLTHVASDTPNNYHLGITQTTATITRNFEGTLNNAVTVNLTAETGYTLSGVTVYVGGVNKTNDYYSNGVVNVPAGATVRGDIVITATAG